MPEEKIKKIDITSTAIEKSFEVAKNFLQSLVKPALDEIGLLISDKIKFWRFKNQIGTLLKAKAILDTKGLKVKEVPLKVLCPLLEGASLEDDEQLQSKWAMLLANYAKEDNNDSTAIFVSILGQLSSKEALFLDLISKNVISGEYLDKDGLIKATRIQEYEMENLARLNLITDQKRKMSHKVGSFSNPRNYFYLTALGEKFVRLCNTI